MTNPKGIIEVTLSEKIRTKLQEADRKLKDTKNQVSILQLRMMELSNHKNDMLDLFLEHEGLNLGDYNVNNHPSDHEKIVLTLKPVIEDRQDNVRQIASQGGKAKSPAAPQSKRGASKK